MLSLFGLIMASSGCPHMEWLRPLARFHLPFSKLKETTFRVLSQELLRLYFTNSDKPIESVAELVQEHYKQVQVVNHCFIERIRSYCDGDADKNAIAALDVFVQIFQFQRQTEFKELSSLFG